MQFAHFLLATLALIFASLAGAVPLSPIQTHLKALAASSASSVSSSVVSTISTVVSISSASSPHWRHNVPAPSSAVVVAVLPRALVPSPAPTTTPTTTLLPLNALAVAVASPSVMLLVGHRPHPVANIAAIVPDADMVRPPNHRPFPTFLTKAYVATMVQHDERGHAVTLRNAASTPTSAPEPSTTKEWVLPFATRPGNLMV